MEKKNIIRLIIQIAIGLIIAVGVMTSQGAFAEGVSVADRILAIGNGFSVCIGSDCKIIKYPEISSDIKKKFIRKREQSIV